MHARIAGAAAVLLALLAGTMPAQDPLPQRDFAVRCGKAHLGDGRVLDDVWLVVRGGRIRSIGRDEPPADLPVLDASSRVVMPGIVAADTDLAEARDEDYAVTPDFQAVDGFDFTASRRDALSGGVTTAYLSPGRKRLVSGQGSVVKLGGSDMVKQVLREGACLHVNTGEDATRAPRVFEPTAFPTADDPLVPARVQRPTARISLLAELRSLFTVPAEAATNGHATDGHLTGPGHPENEYDPAALYAAARGQLPLRVSAQKAQDIRRALQLAEEIGAGSHLVLEDPWEIQSLASRAATLGAAATFRVPVTANAPTPGGEDRRQENPLPNLEAPAIAARAGMRIALAAPQGAPLRDYLWAAAYAVRGGLPQATAMRGLCADAARILGVEDRVGLLAPDKDADFVVLTGDPFAVGTLVETTYVEGKAVYHRTEKNHLLAVRTGRILLGDGRSIGPGTILCDQGRIVAVGEGLSAPYGATVIDLPDGVTTPGFIDAASQLGLAGDGTGVPPGAANQKLHQVIAFDDPMFAGAREAGITTVLVSGKDGGLVSGRIAAIKTGAKSQEAMVVREAAGLRLVYDAIGPDATRGLKDLLDRGRRYAETWQKYEQALADFKAGKAPKPAEQAPAPAPAPSAPDPITGTWEAEFNFQGQIPIKVHLELKLAGTQVTGELRITFAGRESPPQEIHDGTFENGKLVMTSSAGQRPPTRIEATVADDTMTGKFNMGQFGDQDFTAKRTAKGPAAAAAAPAAPSASGEPAKPAVDENLEPLRAMFAKQAAAVIKVSRAPAIRDVVALFEQEQVPYLLQGADGLLDDASVLAGKHPGILLGPELVREENDGTIVDLPARMTALGLPVAIGSSECRGARNLPLHAAYAVRYGWAPEDALAAMTTVPARLFQLDDVGSLQKGRDADFVVFSGGPFEPSSRVLLVVIDGEIVVDHRAEVRR